MPVWGIAASPIIAGDLLIVPACGREAYLVAFDAKTGKEVWRALQDPGNYSAPIIIEQAGQRVLVCWTGDRVVAVDPRTGKLSPDGFRELSRGKLIEPTIDQLPRGGTGVAWAHPAFAYRHVFVRNDKELRCVDLSAR